MLTAHDPFLLKPPPGSERTLLPRVLVVGDAGAPTGFARVLENVLMRLCRNYEFHQLAVNYFGDPHSLGWQLYPAGLHGDPRGFNRLLPLMAQIRPDLLFMMGDLWQLMQYAGLLASAPHRVPAVAYFPVESDPVEPRAVMPLLQHIDHLVTYTAFGEKETQAAIAKARERSPQLPRRPVSVIGHGVDTSVFFPLEGSTPDQLAASRRTARRMLFPDQPELRDAFIVLNANRNQPRKRIDVTLEAFARFAQDKPAGVRLYLHMARQDVGWDIQCLADRFNILDRLIVTRADNESCASSPEMLNSIYNACDIGINTASAEGWGLVSFEHGATGAAQIIPRHTALAELWNGAAEFVEPTFQLSTEHVLTRAYYCSPEDVAKSLQRLYEDIGHRRHLAEAALRLATRPGMEWESLAAQWKRLFDAFLHPDVPSGRP